MIQIKFCLYHFALIIFSSVYSFSDDFFESQEQAMGTLVSHKVFGKNSEIAVREASQRLKELESQLSFHITDSELSRFNQKAGCGEIPISKELFFLFKKSLEYSRLTSGSFNILVGPLVKRWKVTSGTEEIPSPEEIKKLLTLIHYEDLEINEKNSTARLKLKGQMADLGGIAKGFAGDELLSIYKKYGIQSAILDIGGNICLLGKNPEGYPWKIGIQDPLSSRGEYLGYLELSDKALSTSGAYERFFKKNGHLYHHIIDPSTGYPSDSGLLSATVIADKSVDSDALSKIFVMGVDRGMTLIEKLMGTEALLVTQDKKIILSKGLKNIFHLDPKSQYTEVFR